MPADQLLAGPFAGPLNRAQAQGGILGNCPLGSDKSPSATVWKASGPIHQPNVGPQYKTHDGKCKSTSGSPESAGMERGGKRKSAECQPVKVTLGIKGAWTAVWVSKQLWETQFNANIAVVTEPLRVFVPIILSLDGVNKQELTLFWPSQTTPLLWCSSFWLRVLFSSVLPLNKTTKSMKMNESKSNRGCKTGLYRPNKYGRNDLGRGLRCGNGNHSELEKPFPKGLASGCILFSNLLDKNQEIRTQIYPLPGRCKGNP